MRREGSCNLSGPRGRHWKSKGWDWEPLNFKKIDHIFHYCFIFSFLLGWAITKFVKLIFVILRTHISSIQSSSEVFYDFPQLIFWICQHVKFYHQFYFEILHINFIVNHRNLERIYKKRGNFICKEFLWFWLTFSYISNFFTHKSERIFSVV